MNKKPTYEELEEKIGELERHLVERNEAEDDGRTVEVSSSDREIPQQKQVDVALQRSTERFRKLFEQASDAFFIHDFNNGKIVDANECACKNLGYTRDELLELSVSDIEISQTPEIIVEICSRVEKGSPVTVEGVHRRKDGSTFPVEISLGMLQDEDPALLLAIVRDISSRKQAENKLKESEENLRSIFENMQDIYYRLDAKGKILAASPSALKLYKYNSLDEIIGKPADEFVYNIEDSEKFTEELLRKGNVKNYIIKHKRKNGEPVLVETNTKLVLDDQGNPIGSVGVLRDIRERLKAEEALRESEEKYRSMMEAMKDPIYICLPDFRVEYMNPAMIRRTGRDAIGENCFKALHSLNEKCPWCMHNKVQKGKSFESEIVSPKDKRSYHVSHSSIVREDGSISKMTVFRDTTDLRTLEAQLQQAQKMEAIGTLAGGIAHDFNNILGGIMGYAELAKMKAPDESKVLADLEQLIKSSRRAADLVKQILTISRHHKQEQRPVQVRYIVNEVLKLLKATLPTTIEIRGDLAKDTGIVNADPTQMHQVIMNLCTNAGHAMQEDGGMLEVSLANVELDDISASKHLDLNAGFYIRLSVSDSGHGISSEIMERIFDPYFTTKDTGEGTGLGLSVAQGIIKAHGGTITAYSELGKGTTFHVYLPIIHEAEK